MQWYIGNNVRGGRSLYRRVMRSGAAGPQVGVEEIAEGVTDMQLEYLTRTSGVYNSADMITDWPAVVSVRITLVLEGQDNVATDGGRIDRTLTHIVAVRNRTS